MNEDVEIMALKKCGNKALDDGVALVIRELHTHLHALPRKPVLPSILVTLVSLICCTGLLSMMAAHKRSGAWKQHYICVWVLDIWVLVHGDDLPLLLKHLYCM